jgi:calcineurin-like phosphoesterase
MPGRFEVAEGAVIVQGAILDVDEETGRAIDIRRFQQVIEP